ncbi:MAG: hypothetical protein AAFQ53_16215, partial [Bacteroidota bacterium]
MTRMQNRGRPRSSSVPTILLSSFLLALALPACAQEPAPAAPATEDPQPATFRTGAQALVDSAFAALDGMTVGLVTNHTAVVD